ncbi:MAG: HPP family protein [Desulfovibrionaceae bacterium]|nr:HPP family protein [Desulfovibrionaceae bacterium]
MRKRYPFAFYHGETPPLIEVFWSWLGAFAGIGLLAWTDSRFVSDHTDMVLLFGSFGSSAVLLFGAHDTMAARPRNLLCGHTISAFVGVASYMLFGEYPVLAASFAVATAIALMQLTANMHPPGGATALVAVIGGEKIHALGFFYIVMPVLSGALILLFTALFVNNIPKSRRYPSSWW